MEDGARRARVMDDSIRDAIEENATGPQSASTDVGSVSQHSLRDQIEADKYLRQREAASKPHQGMRLVKMIPPGTTD